MANLFANSVSVFLNHGDGTFADNIDYETGARPSGVFVSDIDGDGNIDLAIVNFGSNTISILKNNGNGTFATKINYQTGSHPRSGDISSLALPYRNHLRRASDAVKN